VPLFGGPGDELLHLAGQMLGDPGHVVAESPPPLGRYGRPYHTVTAARVVVYGDGQQGGAGPQGQGGQPGGQGGLLAEELHLDARPAHVTVAGQTHGPVLAQHG